MIQLAPFGKAVTPEVKKQVEAKEKEMKSKDFYPFQGPVVDQSGKTQIPKGTNPTPTELEKTDYLVQGVVGKIPTGSN